MKTKKQKIITVVGQTATGKSELAVHLAKKFNGEIISCDSRQIYKGLNLGTGKITKKEMQNIPHHMLDIVSPQKIFSVVQFSQQTKKIIQDISLNKKVPILCGGTGFYISALVDGITIPQVAPNNILRKKLEKYSSDELFKKLKKLDPRRASKIDSKNKIRLIRAIEIAKALGAVPKIKKRRVYDMLFIGIMLPNEVLKKHIKDRLLMRIKMGMINEAQDLHKKGLTYKRMRELGLEYKYLADFLEKKINKEEFIKKLSTAIWQYAKRQKTWFKRDKRIKWYHPVKNREEIAETVKNFLD